MNRSLTKKLVSLALSGAMLMMPVLSAGAESAIDTIMSAKTTQAFKADAVSQDDLNVILQAGLSAASAINQQPWYFVALTDPEIMVELSAGSGFGAPAGAPAGNAAPAGDTAPSSGAPAGDAAPSSGMPAAPASSGAKAALGDSPVAIIVYMNEKSSSPNPSFDCGLACQNIVLAATALGYGTKIISSPTRTLNGEDHDALCAKLGVDPSLTAVAVILIGYTATEIDGATGASVRNTLEEKISFIN